MKTRVIDGVEYEVLEPFNKCIRPGDGFAMRNIGSFTVYTAGTAGEVGGPTTGFDELRPVNTEQTTRELITDCLTFVREDLANLSLDSETDRTIAGALLAKWIEERGNDE